MALKRELQVGGIVEVGPRYVMAEHPPFAGRGRYEADEWTGKRFRVVGFYRDEAARLAPPDLIGADESDEAVAIHCRRLSPVEVL